MSLLSLCQDAAAEIGVAVPTSIAGNGETTAVRLLAAARREAYALSRAATWSALVREHSFTTTAASLQAGGLASDFAYILDGTAWDRTNRRSLEGPLGGPAWQALQATNPSAGIRRAFRIIGSGFHIHPAPTTAGDEIAYEYATNAVVTAAGGGGRTTWVADDDTFALAEDLATMGVKWRFRKSVGLPYDDDLNEYLAAVERAVARDGGKATLHADDGHGMTFAAHLPDGDCPGS